MAVKEKIFSDRKNRCEERNRFKNGYITQHPTSVDNEEIVRVCGVVIEFFDGFICDNLDFDPFEKFILDMTQKGINLRRKKKLYYKH